MLQVTPRMARVGLVRDYLLGAWGWPSLSKTDPDVYLQLIGRTGERWPAPKDIASGSPRATYWRPA